MSTRNPVSKQSCSAALAGVLVAAVLVTLTAGMAFAQNSLPSQAPAPAAAAPAATAAPAPATAPAATPAFPPQPPPAAADTPKRGLFNNFAQWWDQSIADFKAKWHDQQNKLDAVNKQQADDAKDAAAATSQAMKNAANAMTHFSHIVEVQEKCPLAGNGAADCDTAAANACKAKGYTAGQPLDVRTAEKCSDSLWVSGRTQTAADCPDETVVLRVACQ